jgi:hypothetical protein
MGRIAGFVNGFTNAGDRRLNAYAQRIRRPRVAFAYNLSFIVNNDRVRLSAATIYAYEERLTQSARPWNRRRSRCLALSLSSLRASHLISLFLSPANFNQR